MDTPLRILVTNDDGIHSPGLTALAQALSEVGAVTVIAPDRERSAVGHSLTFHSPLRVRRVDDGDSRITRYTTDGTPTDCVLLGLYDLMPEPPSLLFSGINRGNNLGDDITYSGTVAAALEGTIHGVASVAVSVAPAVGGGWHFEAAAGYAARLAQALTTHRLPRKTLLNVNVPGLPEREIAGIEFTRQGHSLYDQKIVRRVDPWGTEYFWVTGAQPTGEPLEGTDFGAVHRGRISVTPIQLNLTDLDLLKELPAWQI